MNLLLLTASPKKKGGASRLFARLLRGMLWGHRVTVCPLSGRSDFAAALAGMAQSDGVCLSFPLYVDGLPSHVIEFLTLAEGRCQEEGWSCPLYGLANNGFVEGRQNEPALLQLQAWCQRAGLPWGGGVGIGGGTMLLALRIVFPILLAVTLAGILVSLLESGQVPAGLWRALAAQALIGLFLFSGALCCLGRLAGAIRRGTAAQTRYTRVMVPSFLFIPIADLFMVLSSLFQGRLLFLLLGEDKAALFDADHRRS